MRTFRRSSICLKLRGAGQAVDSQGGFNVHTIALNIPIEELGGDQQIVGVYATTSRQRVKILGTRGDATFGDYVQVARQGNPLFNEGLVAIKDKDLYSRTSPEVDATLFRKYALTPELAALINALVFGANVAPTTNRTDIAGHLHPRSDQGRPLDRAGAPRRRRRDASDQSGRPRLLAARHLRRRHARRARCRPGFGNGTVPGGWPNGRRFGDDVVDIAVTALISDLRVSPPNIVGPAGDNVDRQRHRLQQGVPVRGDAAERSHAHALVASHAMSTAGPAQAGSAAPHRLLRGWRSTGRRFAHDPGLSSLDVTSSGDAISASLSISASDVASDARGGCAADAPRRRPRRGSDCRSTARRLAFTLIATLSIDDGARVCGCRSPLAQSRGEMPASGVTPTVPTRSPRPPRAGGRQRRRPRGDGDSSVTRAGRQSRSTSRSARLRNASNAWTFLTLGVRHILSGYDHLVFLAGLILAACSVRELSVALTAFTAAHSLSLALVALGGVHAPPSIVEPLIAGSIAWVGLENLMRIEIVARAGGWSSGSA